MSKRVLLTGASGFVGAHVLREILKTTDWEVVCLSTFTHMGLQDRIIYALEDNPNYKSRVKVLICDLSSPISQITSAKIGKIDYLINCASESHVDRSIATPAEFITSNVAIMCNVLDWARNNPVQKFLHISTDEIYGPYQGRNSVEWDPHLPSNPYSASKAAQEDIAFAYWRTYNVPVGVTNTMNMMGETQDSEKFVPLVIKKVLNDETVSIHTYGEGLIGERFWLHVKAQASAIVHLVKTQTFKLVSETTRYERWNIAGDAKYTNLELAQRIAKTLNKELKYELKDGGIARPGYDSSYALLDNTRLSATKWISPITVDDSLEDVVRWYRDNPEWL